MGTRGDAAGRSCNPMELKSGLIYDWNQASRPALLVSKRPVLNDETLRDGLQSPSVIDPSIGKKIEILHLLEEVGVDSLNLGLPGAGPRAHADVMALAREIVSSGMR